MQVKHGTKTIYENNATPSEVMFFFSSANEYQESVNGTTWIL